MSYIKNHLKSNRLFMTVYRWLYERILGRRRNREMFSRIYEHDRMLADSVRLDAYYRAINKHVVKSDVVVDLGTGTGILSFFAAMKNPEKVYAIDHSDIVEKARRVCADNDISGIEFLRINSRRFECPKAVDVIIHEQIGDNLFDEDMVVNVIDLRDRVLKRGGKILPGRFRFFVEPIKIKDGFRKPFLWEHKPYGINYEALKGEVKQEVGPSYYRKSLRPFEFDYFLCEPRELYSFDLHTMRVRDMPNTFIYERAVTKEGRLDGLCVYFTAVFDDEIELSNSPEFQETHWFSRLLKTESREYKRGDSLGFELSMDDPYIESSWRWSVRP